jgi:hypothetical protein
MSDGLNASDFGHLLGSIHAFNASWIKILNLQHQGILKQIDNAIPRLPTGLLSTQTILFILCIAWALEPLFERRPVVTGAVYHGYSSWLEPTRFLRARFIFNARQIIASGSLKVCHTNRVVVLL